METRFGAAGRTMFNLGVIGAAGTAAFTAKSVQAFINFDEAMTRSTAIMDNISGPVRKRLEDAAKSVARVTTFSATEAANAFYGLFSAGLDAEQAISALPVVAQFAQAGLMDMATATDFLVNAQSALGMSMDDPIANMKEMQRVADVLTETNNLATGTVEEFADALTHKAGAALKTVGKDIEEGTAALAYLAEQGIRGSRAGESLAIFIRDVSRAAGNESFRGAFRDFGIEVFNAEGNLKNLADVVAEFEQALGPMSDEQRAVTLEQLGLTRSVGDVIRQMMGGSQAIRDYETALRNAGGATQSVADKQMESLRAKIDVIKNRLNVLMIEFGEPVAIWLVETFFPWFETKFMPALREAAALIREELRPAFDAVAKALDNPTFIKVLAAFTGYVIAFNSVSKVAKSFSGALVFLLKPIGKLIGLFGKILRPILMAFIPLMKLVAAGVSALAAALGLPVLVVVAIIAAIVLVVAALYIFRDEVMAALKAVGRFFMRLWDDIYGGFIGPIIRFFTGPFVDFWKAVWKTVEGPLKVFLRVVQVFGSIMLALFLAPFIIVMGTIVAIVMVIVNFFREHWTLIWQIIKTVWDRVVDATTAVWNYVILPLITGVWNSIYTAVRGNIILVLGIIRTIWNAVSLVTMTVWNAIKVHIFGVWHFIRDQIAKPLAAFWSAFVVPKLQAFWQTIVTIWNAIKTAFQAAWHWVRDNVAKPFMNYWADTVAPKLVAFRDLLSRIWDQIKNTASAVWNGIVGAIRTPVNLIIKVINGLIDGINTVIGLINKIPGVDIPNIPRIPLISAGTSGSNAQQPLLRGGAHAMGTYDLAKRGPFMTHGPRAIVGEGDPRFPEYVIPTDPRFRTRAHSLFSGLAGDLGIGFQFGGIIDGVSSGIRGAIGLAGGFVEGVIRGSIKAAFAPFNEAAKAGLNQIPNAFKMRDIAQGFRELIWQVVSGADGGFPEATDTADSYKGGAGVEQWRQVALRALQATGSPAGWIGSLLRRMNQESGGNPLAVNLWDVNALRGTPSVGLMQVIGPTFRAHARAGARGPFMFGTSVDPFENIYASIRYANARYGSAPKGWNRAGGYRNGLYDVPVDNFPARLHRKEMVLPAAIAEAARGALEHGTTQGSKVIHIENLNIIIDGAASVDDARRKARAAGKAFLGVLEERRVLTDARIS